MFYRRSNFIRYTASRQRGAALVVALLVFAVSASLVVAMRAEFNRYFTRSANLLMAEQANAYLRGAEELAKLVLIADYELDQQNLPARDDLQEQWAREAQPFLLDEGGWLRGEIEDLNRRFNINALLPGPIEKSGPQRGKRLDTPAQEQFIRLLQALGEPPVSLSDARLITESIGDWIDGDQQPLPNGAEDDYYFGQEPAHRTADRPMSSTSELLSIAYMTPQIYRALAPYVMAGPSDPADFKINIHTAPAMILRTINKDKNLNPLSESEGQSLEDYRKEQGFEDVADFFKQPVFSGDAKDYSGVNALLDVMSTHFLVRADVEVADRNMRLYSVLHQKDRAVSVLLRSSGDL